MQLTSEYITEAVAAVPFEEDLCRRLPAVQDLPRPPPPPPSSPLVGGGGVVTASTVPSSPPTRFGVVVSLAAATKTTTTTTRNTCITTATTTKLTTTTVTTSSGSPTRRRYDDQNCQPLEEITSTCPPESRLRWSPTLSATSTTVSQSSIDPNDDNECKDDHDHDEKEEDNLNASCTRLVPVAVPSLGSSKGLKRKHGDDDDDDDNEDDNDDVLEEKKEARILSPFALERYRRLLLARRLIGNLNHGGNVPLFTLYGDLLLIPRYKWGSGGIGMGGGDRRGSFDDPDFAPPIDPSSSLEAASHHHSRSKTPSLVQVCPDAQSLEEGGFSQIWFAGVMQLVMRDLNKYGVCVVDNFLGSERADQIRSEVEDLHVRGVFRDGQVVSRNVQDQARGIIRGDKITWVTGNEPSCGNIGQLVSVVDNLIAKANKHQDAGELARYNITWRTRAMVACYPGQGSHYVKHVDNPDGDGRCITAIYYINKGWTPRDGGELRIYPEGSNKVAKIDPVFDRMLFFWSDRRNPHEVLPATVTRFAITVWYHDQTEREEYLSRVSRNPTNT